MTYVMSDIHGYLNLFNSILRKVHFSDDDSLYVLGDVIDRGPDGIKILLKIMRSKNMFMVIGNHEYMMLQYFLGDKKDFFHALANWASNGCDPTIKQFKSYAESTQNRILRFVKNLPIEYRLEINGRKYILCHSQPAVSSFKKKPIMIFSYTNETEFSVWCRERIKDENFNNLTIIHGHTPVFNYDKYAQSENNIYFSSGEINVDCGCAVIDYLNNRYRGRLGCLRLEDMKEYYLENIKTNIKM